MNKYRKALETLISSNVKLCVYNDVDYEQQPTLFDLYHSELFALQELVDKEMPKKVLEVSKEEFYESGYKYCCPNCGMLVGTITKDGGLERDDYCCSCGQMLNWEDVKDE